MSTFLTLVFMVTLVAFPILWWKKRKAKKEFGADSEQYKKMTLIKRVVGAVCVLSFFGVGAMAPPQQPKDNPKPEVKQEQTVKPEAKQEQAAQEPVKQKHIYDDAKSVDMMNGMGTKVIGKVSIIEAESTDVTQEVLEDWYFNYAKPHEKDFNYFLILYTDKGKSMGVLCNSALVTKDCPLDKDKHGETYSQARSGGTIMGPTDDGHLKPLEKK